MREKNYNKLVNPTFTTGQATLEMLAASGNPDAITYKQLLAVGGATEKVSGSANDQNQIFTPEEGRALMMGVTLGIEARYAAVSRLLRESGCKSMLDLASGYTPRALMCKNAGIDYVGIDLPAVVEQMGPLAEKLFGDTSHPVYLPGDVTNAASVKKGADLLEGELFISSEGLLTYLNKSELIQTIRCVRQILLEHGGAWYTSDMDVHYDRFSAVAINKPDVLERWARIMGSIKKETDVYFFPAAFDSTEEKIAFFEAQGLHVEPVPFYTDETRLNILHGFDPQGQERMKQLMKSFHMWKMTAVADEAEATVQSANGLHIRAWQQGDTLQISLSGRLDTLSSPDLLQLLDDWRKKESFSQLVFELEQLEYISSTGLRVFLMMAKRLGPDHLVVENSSEFVREIFETTGFTEVITLR